MTIGIDNVADPYNNVDPTNDDPYRKAFTVVPSDSVNFSVPTRGVYVGGTGDIVVLMMDDTTTVTMKAVPVGSFLRIRAKRINSTSTTATLMVGFY